MTLCFVVLHHKPELPDWNEPSHTHAHMCKIQYILFKIVRTYGVNNNRKGLKYSIVNTNCERRFYFGRDGGHVIDCELEPEPLPHLLNPAWIQVKTVTLGIKKEGEGSI